MTPRSGRSLGLPIPLSTVPAPDGPRCLEMISGTRDEEEFYLSSVRIGLRGAEALKLMRETMAEALVGNNASSRPITSHPQELSVVIKDLSKPGIIWVFEGTLPLSNQQSFLARWLDRVLSFPHWIFSLGSFMERALSLNLGIG